ncbi:MAG TPA: HypC/HybG/HupF family hydrogenase formation chaperone [Firmicutes bacterium]|nr:HypC/HybG/HupF family hydrogenase formation chaperone [Bacillota bacterium]
MCIAFPGVVVSVDNEKGYVDFLGVRREVCLSLVPGAKVGDFVLVHAGFAIEQLDPGTAEDLMSILKEIDDELGEVYDYGP